MAVLAAIPDIHGEAGRLERLLAAMDRRWPDAKLVFLGDYVNRGPDSAAVIRLVRERTGRGHVALRGNHEEMLLDYVHGGGSYVLGEHLGGLATLRSFEREAGRPFDRPADLARYLQSEGILAWLEQLPVHHRHGNVVFTHAPVAAEHWEDGVPDARVAVNADVGGGDEYAYMDALGAPEGCFAVCGHVITLATQRREGLSSPLPDAESPITALVTDQGYVLEQGRFDEWPETCGIQAPMIFPGRGAYLDCGCGYMREGPLIAAVFDGVDA